MRLKLTFGKVESKLLTDAGVQNIFDRIILSSKTLCSFKTVTAVLAVLPVPDQNLNYTLN